MRLIPFTAERFLDVRTHGFFRVAVAVPKVRVTDPAENLANHMEVLERARQEGAMYTLCPELGLSSYSAGDMHQQNVLTDECLSALGDLLERTHDWNMVISVGMPIKWNGALWNCGVTFLNGRILCVVPKAYPPEYREFYEGRHFACANEALEDTIDILGQSVPFGTDILVTSAVHRYFVLHTEICEDGWVAISPSAIACLMGATVSGNLSASNITIDKDAYRRDNVVVGPSGQQFCVKMYAAAGFGESTSDLAWDGHAMIAARGALLVENVRYSMDGSVIVYDVNLPQIENDRERSSSWRQNAAQWKQKMRRVTFTETLGATDASLYRTFRAQIDARPFVPADPAQRNRRRGETFSMQQSALATRMVHIHKMTGRWPRLVAAISGGKDSTHAGNVILRTLDALSLPRDHAVFITMRGFGTTDETYRLACEYIRASGAQFREIPISDIALKLFELIGHDPAVENATFENAQAWIRTQITLAVASQVGGFMVGTGDLDEGDQGWTTMFGDHASHYNVNAGVAATLMQEMVLWTGEVVFKDDAAMREPLLAIAAMQKSPELTRKLQITENLIGPYALHGFYMYWIVRFGIEPATVARMALQAFDGEFDLPTIKTWLKLHISRFFGNQFKRNAVPDGPKIGMVSESPRGDLRMPSDASPAPWLRSVERIPDSLDAPA